MGIQGFLGWFCVFDILLYSTFAQSNTNTGFYYRLYHINQPGFIAYIRDLYPSTDFRVPSRTDCALFCAQDPFCKAFYLKEINSDTNQEPNSLYHCTILSEWLNQVYFFIENGVLGIIENSSVTVNNIKSPPVAYNSIGDLITIRINEAGISAVYDLSQRNPRATSLGILYNENNIAWPNLTVGCAEGLMYQPGLSATFLNITQTPTQAAQFNFSAKIVCPHPDDAHHSDAECDGTTGNWTLPSGSVKVGCVSDHCYRHDGIEHGIFQGVQSESVSGITCQRWDSQAPNAHNMEDEDFILDHYDMTKAENYCRDPDGEGFPWCYQVSGDRWDTCGIPLCQI